MTASPARDRSTARRRAPGRRSARDEADLRVQLLDAAVQAYAQVGVGAAIARFRKSLD